MKKAFTVRMYSITRLQRRVRIWRRFFKKSWCAWRNLRTTGQAKANDTYYLLKKTEAPTVIVECGFLSNWEECAKLRNEDYQAKLVWAIQMGILKYLNKK